MKRNLFFILLFCVAIIGCKKDKELLYSSQDNIYLNYPKKDTLKFSFALFPSLQQDTLWIPVIISGKRVSRDRKFQLSVVADSTTALATINYEPLKPFYIMPADSGTTHVPVIIKSTDTALYNKSVRLTIRVSGGTDFGSGLVESIRTKQIVFSNQLEEPSWWSFWEGEGEFGDYTRTKYQLFLISSGTTTLGTPGPGDFNSIPEGLFYIGNFTAFLSDPFGWVSQNPQKGYVLTATNDGTGDYYFYSTSNPTKKILLEYLPQSATYVFIDENGNPVVLH